MSRASAKRLSLQAGLVIAVMSLSLVLALDGDTTPGADLLDAEVSPLPALPSRCPLQGSETRSHARALEQLAAARWERVPFAPEEAARAVLQMAEAERCYATAGERDAMLRAEQARELYARELMQRFVHARLLLRAALREGRTERVRTHAEQLRALLAHAPEEAQRYRAELAQRARIYTAGSLEQTSREEER